MRGGAGRRPAFTLTGDAAIFRFRRRTAPIRKPCRKLPPLSPDSFGGLQLPVLINDHDAEKPSMYSLKSRKAFFGLRISGRRGLLVPTSCPLIVLGHAVTLLVQIT